MTEITANSVNTHYIIDPVAFFIALIGGPLLFTAATFWLALIPVFALALGAIPYLVVGIPVLLLHLRRHPPEVDRISTTALKAFLVLWATVCAGAWLRNMSAVDAVDLAALAGIILIFGSVFSLCWGACFGWLYRALARDFYTRAVST